jgi:hypothetical protein
MKDGSYKVVKTALGRLFDARYYQNKEAEVRETELCQQWDIIFSSLRQRIETHQWIIAEMKKIQTSTAVNKERSSTREPTYTLVCSKSIDSVRALIKYLSPWSATNGETLVCSEAPIRQMPFSPTGIPLSELGKYPMDPTQTKFVVSSSSASAVIEAYGISPKETAIKVFDGEDFNFNKCDRLGEVLEEFIKVLEGVTIPKLGASKEELIPDHRWDRRVVKLWNDGHDCKEIADKIGDIAEKTVRNRLTELRKLYGDEIVPTDKQLKKIGKKFRTSGY